MPRASPKSMACKSFTPPAVDPAAPLVFVVNGASGRTDADGKRLAIETALQAAGRRGEILMAGGDELPRIADEAVGRAVREHSAVVAVGGDGTLSAVAAAAHAQGCPMGVVPLGTFNFFARTHGIPTDAAQATAALLEAAVQPVQVGTVNGRVFLVNASVGLYPELLEDRESHKSRFGRNRAVALASTVVSMLREHRQLRLQIQSGQAVRELRTSTLFVGNNRLQLERVGVAEAPAVEEGRIAVVVLKPMGMIATVGLLLRGALGTLGDADQVETFDFQRLVVRPWLPYGRRGIKVAYDGEVAWMRGPLEFQVAEQPLYLLKPASE